MTATTTIDATTMRRINKTLVFRTVYEQSPVSRVEIARKLGLNKATVSSVVDELLQEGFVKEVGLGNSRSGRKPVLLSIDESAGYGIGIDVQISHIRSVLCDLSGKIVHERQRPMFPIQDQHMSKEVFIRLLKEEISDMLSLIQESTHGAIGVGIALPGMLNGRTGQIHHLPNLEISNLNIKDALSDFDIPIFIENDANCGVLTEFNRCQSENIVFIQAGIGIGVGIMSNGQIVRGAHGVAGEFGHTTISAMGIRCSCGSYGCWEQYASEQALLRYLGENGVDVSEAFSNMQFLEHSLNKASMGDATYLNAFKTLINYFKIGLSNVVNAVNPGKIFIGGNLSMCFKALEPELADLYSNNKTISGKSIPIHFSDPKSVVIGASILAFSPLFESERDSILHSTAEM